MKKYFSFAAILLFCFICSSAFAHGVNLFCYIEGSILYGEGYFNGGNPSCNSQVTVYALDTGAVIASAVTDDEGRFSVELKDIIPVKVVMNSGQGHRAEFIIKDKKKKTAPDNKLSVKQTGSFSDEEVKALVDDAVRPLQQRIVELEKKMSRPSFADIAGGIGWIFIIFYIIGIIRKKNAL